MARYYPLLTESCDLRAAACGITTVLAHDHIIDMDMSSHSSHSPATSSILVTSAERDRRTRQHHVQRQHSRPVS